MAGSSTPSPVRSSRAGWTGCTKRWGCDDDSRRAERPVNLFGHAISMPQLFGQLLIGLINGSFYALLSLGLAVIFGMLTIVNFAHGAFYMMGAFAAYFLLQYA